MSIHPINRHAPWLLQAKLSNRITGDGLGRSIQMAIGSRFYRNQFAGGGIKEQQTVEQVIKGQINRVD